MVGLLIRDQKGNEIGQSVPKFICHKRESSGFFSEKNLPKPKKGSNLFFEVQIVGFT